MKTPRIEEMVEEFMASFNWDAITSDNESNLKAVAKELTKTLTEAITKAKEEERERILNLKGAGQMPSYEIELTNNPSKNYQAGRQDAVADYRTMIKSLSNKDV